MHSLPGGSNVVKGPVRNDRVVINAINAVYRNVDLSNASDEDKYVLLRTISFFIGGMKYEQGHANVARAWRKLVNDLFPRGGDTKYQWIDHAIMKQKEN